MFLNHEDGLMDDNRCFRINCSDCEVTADKRNSKLQRVKISERNTTMETPSLQPDIKQRLEVRRNTTTNEGSRIAVANNMTLN
jgi:uncharacterized membrane protein